VSKVRDSAYASGRGNSWVKKTCTQRETLTIAGFALDEGKWDGIYIGRRKGDDLIYAGKVDHGFDKSSAADLQKRLKPLIRKSQPYANRVAHRGIWVEPKLLPRSSTGRSRPKERSGTRSSRVCGRICDGCIRPLLAVGGQATRQRADDHRRAPPGCDGARSGGPPGPRESDRSRSACEAGR